VTGSTAGRHDRARFNTRSGPFRGANAAAWTHAAHAGKPKEFLMLVNDCGSRDVGGIRQLQAKTYAGRLISHTAALRIAQIVQIRQVLLTGYRDTVARKTINFRIAGEFHGSAIQARSA